MIYTADVLLSSPVEFILPPVPMVRSAGLYVCLDWAASVILLNLLRRFVLRSPDQTNTCHKKYDAYDSIAYNLPDIVSSISAVDEMYSSKY